MRYYVVCGGDESDASFIIAEVVGVRDEDRDLSIASSLAGAKALVVTQEELLQTVEGINALDRWEARDDSRFDAETIALNATSRRSGSTRLQVVATGDGSPKAPDDGLLPRNEAHRAHVLRARALRDVTRALVARSRASRLKMRNAKHAPDEVIAP